MVKSIKITTTAKSTPPIAKIICVKNVRADVVCGIFFLIKRKLCWKYEKDSGSHFGVACEIALPIQPNLCGNGIMKRKIISWGIFQMLSDRYLS